MSECRRWGTLGDIILVTIWSRTMQRRWAQSSLSDHRTLCLWACWMPLIWKVLPCSGSQTAILLSAATPFTSMACLAMQGELTLIKQWLPSNLELTITWGQAGLSSEPLRTVHRGQPDTRLSRNPWEIASLDKVLLNTRASERPTVLGGVGHSFSQNKQK